MARNMKMAKKTNPALPLRTTTHTSGDRRLMKGLDCSLHNADGGYLSPDDPAVSDRA
jgi:hypothetical protein